MAGFTDLFDRADGALGSDWTVLAGSWSIISGKAHAGAYAWAKCASDTIAGSGTASLLAVYPGLNNGHARPWIKADSSFNNGYFPDVIYNGTAYVGTIYRWNNPVGTNIGTGSWTTSYTSAAYIQLTYASGTLTLKVNGHTMCQASDNSLAANSAYGMGMANTTTDVESFGVDEAHPPSFDVSPDPIGNYGSTTALTFTGVNTAWTPGTPGDPTFTVDHGTLTEQTVSSATSAGATYDPGTFLGTATFTDPSTSMTCEVLVTSDPGVVIPPGTTLSPDVIAYLERSAAASVGGPILNADADATGAGASIDVVTAIGEVHASAHGESYTLSDQTTTTAILYMLWDILTHRGVAGADASFRDVLAQLLTNSDEAIEPWQVGETTGRWKVDEVLDILGGISRKSHVDILDAIDGISIDPSEIIDEIHALRGAEGSTVEGAIALVQALSTIAGYDLSTVRDWIEAVRGTNLPTIADVLVKLGRIQTGNLPDLATIDQHISTMSAVTTAIDLVLGAQNKLPGTMAYVLDDVYDIVSGLQTPAAGGLANLWPGEDNVTLGEEVELADGLELVGPFNGLLLTITDLPARYTTYQFGEVNSWARVGAVIFCTDRGDYERSQTFSLDRQILIPATMEVAASAVFRVNFGWGGTVRGWTRNT